MCLNKVRLPTKGLADLLGFMSNGAKARTYECPLCKQFHISTRPYSSVYKTETEMLLKKEQAKDQGVRP